MRIGTERAQPKDPRNSKVSTGQRKPMFFSFSSAFSKKAYQDCAPKFELATITVETSVLGERNKNVIQKLFQSRWPRRFLLLGCGLMSALFFLGAIAPEPKLRPREEKAMQAWSEASLQTAELIDEQMQEKIDTAGLFAAPAADWQTVCRRLSLALVGNSLSLEELRAIEQVDEEHRIEWWTDYLLSDSRWSHYFAERFSRAYVGTNQGPFLLFRKRKFQLWLADEFRQGTPYNEIVRRMFVAEGLWTDRPEVNFLTSTIEEGKGGRVDPILLAGRTSRAFLGMRIDCLQCHDDLLGNVHLGSQESHRDGTQLDFHQLAAFFSRSRVAGSNALAGLRDDKRPYRVQMLGDSDETVVEPKVPYLESLDVASNSPREKLASWLTHSENKPFARAAVNRVWAILFGTPLVNPVDSIPIHGPFPPGLESLSEAFVDSKYDLKELVRTIVSTKAFRRDSRIVEQSVTAEHEATWATFPLTQLRPEQVAASLLQACRLQMIDNDSSILAQLELFGTQNDFLKEYGDRGDDEFASQSITLPQRLVLMNGKFLRERIDENPILNANSQITLLAASNNKAIEATYLSTLNRLPSESERQAFIEAFDGKKQKARTRAISDLFWVLINSTEFLWNH